MGDSRVRVEHLHVAGRGIRGMWRRARTLTRRALRCAVGRGEGALRRCAAAIESSTASAVEVGTRWADVCLAYAWPGCDRGGGGGAKTFSVRGCVTATGT
jgi:hypothetical protein